MTLTPEPDNYLDRAAAVLERARIAATENDTAGDPIGFRAAYLRGWAEGVAKLNREQE